MGLFLWARWWRSSPSSRRPTTLFQYRQWYDRQKMSVREMKEEFRQTEGDPAIKGKIRQLRMARAQAHDGCGAKASVVITNPTHFAVALQYERGMNAPFCVAKGADLIARKIREVAEAHDIPVVETPRSPERCTAPSRSTRKSRRSITALSPKSSAM